MSGPALNVVARLYTQQGYRRASVDPNHPGTPLTGLHEAAEWRQIAELRWQMIEDLTAERDALRATLAAPAPVAPQDDARDAERLDFLIEREAFVTASKTRIDPTLKYQCWSRDEDEDYRYLSGEHEHFDTAREAIDAAIVLSTPAAKPTEPTLPTQGEQSHD